MYTHLYLVDQDLGHMAMGVWGGVFSVVKHTFNQNSLVAQRIKRLPAMRETQVGFLGWEDPLEKEWLPIPVFLPGEFRGQRKLA